MEENKIIVSGKEIDFSNFSDEKLDSLYNQLLARQATLIKKAKQYIENGQIRDINIDNIQV